MLEKINPVRKERKEPGEQEKSYYTVEKVKMRMKEEKRTRRDLGEERNITTRYWTGTSFTRMLPNSIIFRVTHPITSKTGLQVGRRQGCFRGEGRKT